MEVSDKSAKFEIANNEAKKETEVEIKSPVDKEDVIQEYKEDLNAPYIHRNNVTIKLVKNYSLYRKANDKVLPKRKDFIGSSVTSSRILSSNKGEVESYFPNIIGLSTNDPNFIMRVKQYLNNIRVDVDELGRSFDISFYYNHKKDYYRVKAEEDSIEKEFSNVNRQNMKLLKEAIKNKITRINNLESTKHLYGYPVNVEDYLMYRHCLLYKDVAKDIALINEDPNIRFYIKDDKKEEEKLKKFRQELNKAKVNYVSCLSDSNMFDAVYIQYCAMTNKHIISSINKDKLEREIELDKFSADEPTKFNKIFNDKNIKLIANIELLIAHGELIRSQYNQNITSTDGELIGANMTEAVAWFKNAENANASNVYLNKLKEL